MSKKIFLNKDGREGLSKGIEEMFLAVSSTLGPMGKSVIIKSGYEDPQITKDGVTVANSMDSDDPLKNTAMQMLKKVCSKMDFDSGDGTTTTTILCYYMIKHGFADLEKDIDLISYRKGMDKALADFIEYVDRNAMPAFDDFELLKKVATISCNNDEELGELIAEAVMKSGKYGQVNVIESIRSESGYENIEGYLVDLGLADATFGIDPKTGFFIGENASLLLYKGSITSKSEWLKIAKDFDKQSNPFIIIAQDYSTEVQSLASHVNGLFGKTSKKICLVRNNLRENEFNAIYEDLMAYTGATVVEEYEDNLCLGDISSITVKPGHMILGSSNQDVQEHIDILEERISEQKSPAAKEDIKKRIARFQNGLVNFYVGGNSDIETKERYHRVQDAVNACKAAVEQGVVAGGGQTFYKFSTLESTANNSDLGYKNVSISLIRILTHLYETSTKEIPLAEIFYNSMDNIGYDFKKNEPCDMFVRGILDPAKIVKNAAINAVSVAGTILTTECVIID